MDQTLYDILLQKYGIRFSLNLKPLMAFKCLNLNLENGDQHDVNANSACYICKLRTCKYH